MNVLSSLLNFIGNKIGSTTMGTTATTLTGAIAEHESDISSINTKLSSNGSYIATYDSVNLNNATANIANSVTNYSYLIVEFICQGWTDTYIIPTQYTATVHVTCGYNGTTSCTMTYVTNQITFSNATWGTGVTSANVRIYGIRK